MNATDRELKHWRPESYRTLRDAGVHSEIHDPLLHRAERVLSLVGWIGGVLLLAVILFW